MEVYFCACAVERGADAQNTKEGPEKEEIRRKEEREREAAKRQEAVSTSSSVLLPASSDWRFSLRSSTILLERILASTAATAFASSGKGPPRDKVASLQLWLALSLSPEVRLPGRWQCCSRGDSRHPTIDVGRGGGHSFHGIIEVRGLGLGQGSRPHCLSGLNID